MIGRACQRDGVSSAPRIESTEVLQQGDNVAGSAPAIADGLYSYRVSPV
jgi:hypothetical protein